jgi:sporulation-control protein spo0M
MGFFDKLKGAMNAVTGGAAKVTLELSSTSAFPAGMIRVKLYVTSTGGEVNSKGAFVDLMAVEQIRLPKDAAPNLQADVSANKTTYQQEIKIAPEFKLAAGETKYFEGVVVIPATAQPSYDGPWADHAWAIRGRIDTFGNDPDSGYQPIKIGLTA